jgi:small subunit ribosomal protein S8
LDEGNRGMSMTDPVADMLTRIRNANSLMRGEVSMPSTAIKISIAEVLKREGFIKDFFIVNRPLQNELKIELKYGPEGEKVIRRIQRTSKPGSRVYRGYADIPVVLSGQGVAIVSTNQGVLSDHECRDKKVGGEVRCTVY